MILVVVVCFNQSIDKSLSISFFKNQSQYFDLIIYDNSTIHYPCDTLDIAQINIIRDENNSGLSKAYNYAASFAKENGYDWLLIADQDTFFPENALEIYNSAIKDNPDISLFIPKVKTQGKKYMSPVKMRHYVTKLQDSCPIGIINPSDYGIINSGLLIKVDAFWAVGGYNEKVWLDFADFQFIERFGSKFDKAFVVDMECVQSFSNEEQSISQKLSRYKHFCTSVKHYEPVNKLNKFWINLIVFKRAGSLCIQSKSLSPIITYFQKYLR